MQFDSVAMFEIEAAADQHVDIAGEKARGVRTTEERFALALTHVMNDLGAEGWDYVRADALPCDERVGLTGSKTTFQNMLVFRRILEADQATQPSRLMAVDPIPAAANPPTTERQLLQKRRLWRSLLQGGDELKR